MQCVDCVAEGAKSIPATRTVFGGRTVGTPRVTQALIAVCAAAYVLQLTQRSTTETFAFVPLLGWEQPWRALTAAFLHSPTTPLHLALNMFWLWQIGGYLESLLGRARFLALYLVCAIGGSAGVLLLAPAPRAILRSSAEAAQYAAWGTAVVGASGAVFGLFGALLVLNRHLGRSSAALYGVLAVNVVFGFVVPGIAWQAHLGGLVTGVIVAGVFAVLSTRERRTLQWPALAVVLVVIVAAMVLQYQGVPDLYR